MTTGEVERAQDPRVAKVSFTGSTDVGVAVLLEATDAVLIGDPLDESTDGDQERLIAVD
jgi:hypothetical protein